ncbi:aromatic ring-hydroxylating dioxygenase subunit alpha [Pusillimonas sp. CC-YST705]|uniref:Aromatic ring-hydroxylating dioxygenase subunit alpha n=1 Tax=Mesopusillimonas faecipullorum TaxID=2755040 RepID=A0ABS8CER7_9BURK|nr:aromatic ring-hydroxylating dioxygenase subunit alpha [Mesopusillimonas faecipullorum]MCB5364508.1 aromatic ring-hydroxylating dioxygenase subunit alpha [Mesopusillimonas faecipullorum]
MFPKNTWYVACTPDEIEKKPLGRQICGERMVFFRGAAGQVSALDDFCPHRGAALSLGYVHGDTLVCGYHGLAVDCDGKVASMPMQRVGGFPRTRVFPVVERHGFIWVWPGDPALADDTQIPFLEWHDNPEWAYGGGLYHIKADYRLMIDNLMDLTHEAYVHTTSIGQDEIDETPVNTSVNGDTVETSRFMEGVIAPPFWQAALRYNGLPADQPVDRWQISRFTPPSHVLIDVGVAVAGKGGRDADPKYRVRSTVVDFITPETESSHWYFWGMARNFQANDHVLTQTIRSGQGKIFGEDLAVLEAQQKNLEVYPDRRLLMLNIDTGGVQSRRVLDRLIKAEQATSVEPA